ncbi:hypothetical protein P886_3028 [Alteromonadaceae bacterium 2753L.S.0a.02]|nr:hypothetical protein P886_3028 [Alteromonadaceae bacterium 2753L.S.0a.02]
MKTVVYLAGGVGNNFFQICLGEHLKSLGCSVVYNRYFIKHNIVTRTLGWSIHDDVILSHVLENESVENTISLAAWCYLIRRFVLAKFFGKERLLSYEESRFKGPKKYYFGYWQKGIHLNDDTFALLSRKISSFVDKWSVGKKVKKCSHLVHVRHGDFPESERLTSTNFYRDVFKILGLSSATLIAAPGTELDNQRVFGANVSISYDRGGSALDDFVSLYYAKLIIVSNSTYCYWAANLGLAETIVYPSMLGRGRVWDLNWSKNKNTRMCSVFW